MPIITTSSQQQLAALNVATIAELRAVNTSGLPDRTTRLVEDVGLIYRFDATGTGSDDGDATITPTLGPGRWFKLSGGASVHAATHISGGADAFTSSQLLEAVVKRIQTSTGPTTLTVGAVTDGEFLKRSGSTIISASVSTSTPVDGWLSTYYSRALTKTGITAANAEIFYEDFKYRSGDWLPVSGSQARTTSTDSNSVGGTIKLAGNGTQYHYFIGGYGATDTTTFRYFKATGRWYMAWRVKIVTPTVPIPSTYDTRFFAEAVYNSTQMYMAAIGSVSTSKWVYHPFTGSNVLSTVNISNNWTVLEAWSDGTTIYFSVDDETPVTGPAAADQNTTRVDLGYYASSGATYDVRMNKLMAVYDLSV